MASGMFPDWNVATSAETGRKEVPTQRGGLDSKGGGGGWGNDTLSLFLWCSPKEGRKVERGWESMREAKSSKKLFYQAFHQLLLQANRKNKPGSSTCGRRLVNCRCHWRESLSSCQVPCNGYLLRAKPNL